MENFCIPDNFHSLVVVLMCNFGEELFEESLLEDDFNFGEELFEESSLEDDPGLLWELRRMMP